MTFRGTLVTVVLGVGVGFWAWYSLGQPTVTSSKPRPVPGSVVKNSESNAAQVRKHDASVPLVSHLFVDDSGYGVALGSTPPILDRSNLKSCEEALAARYARGVADLEKQLASLDSKPAPANEIADARSRLRMLRGLLEMYEGRFDHADSWFERAADDNPSLSQEMADNLTALRGIASMRRGELENCVACVGASTCIYPLAPEAVHSNPSGSRRALEFFDTYLKHRPEDLGVKWLSHVARLTIGDFESARDLGSGLHPSWISERPKAATFANRTLDFGLDTRGPNMLGGSWWDDFDGDKRPDLFITSGDWNKGASLFARDTTGIYVDKAENAGLSGMSMAVNLVAADYDNDGDLDALLLRGGWETPYPLSLLRNRDDGTFEDVTGIAGLGEPIATQSAGWADYDLDGDLDLYVAGEYHDRNATPLNHNRLYRNEGDGTFRNVAEAAGVINQAWAKGVAWGDYDDDGRPDIYVSNMNGFNRLYRNLGDGTFEDKASELGLIEPVRSFSCWFWDFDDDGRQDLFVTGFGASLFEIVSDMSGIPGTKGERPRLYRNRGKDGFEEVSESAGLRFVTLPMGTNFADYDNDGRLDFYLATGWPPYSVLIPNRMFRNVDGSKFDDVTVSTGTGHLQKGHGVSFADHDFDGDLDLFVQTGGQTPADKAHNVLFENGTKGRHWLNVRLEGRKSNRSAIGAKVMATISEPDGSRRTIHRVVGQNSSFGGNSLALHLGLDRADKITELVIRWPNAARSEERFENVAADRFVKIVEGTGRIDDTPFSKLPDPK
ncbi:hypothetical protein GC170_04450 [bacterium]|nr:hypothetical protein [bacterium]